jgi:hypothetical protein
MDLTVNDQRVIVERHHGWEGASPSLLARVFGTSPQRITAIVTRTCAVCGKPICGHRDDEWSGEPQRDGLANAVAPSRAAVEVGRADLSHPTTSEAR